MARNKKNPSLKYTFMVVPSNDSDTRSFSIHRFWLRLFMVLALFVIAAAVVIAATYGKLLQTAVNYSELQEKYQLVMAEREKVMQIAQDLRKIQRYKEQVSSTLTGYVDMGSMVADSSAIETPVSEFTRQSREEIADLTNAYLDFPVKSPLKGFVTRAFQLSGGEYNHFGIDLAAAKGTPVTPAGRGVVIFAGWTKAFGNTVIILHRDGFHTHYAHLANISVNVSDYVDPGDVLGNIGSTGERSSGIHLHFELWRHDVPLDPLKFIPELND